MNTVERAVAGTLLRSEKEHQEFALRRVTSVVAFGLIFTRGQKPDHIWETPQDIKPIHLVDGRYVRPQLVCYEHDIEKKEQIRELELKLVEEMGRGSRMHNAANISHDSVRDDSGNELYGEDLEKIRAILDYMDDNLPLESKSGTRKTSKERSK